MIAEETHLHIRHDPCALCCRLQVVIQSIVRHVAESFQVSRVVKKLV